jgi:hypothetical protein
MTETFMMNCDMSCHCNQFMWYVVIVLGTAIHEHRSYIETTDSNYVLGRCNSQLHATKTVPQLSSNLTQTMGCFVLVGQIHRPAESDLKFQAKATLAWAQDAVAILQSFGTLQISS